MFDLKEFGPRGNQVVLWSVSIFLHYSRDDAIVNHSFWLLGGAGFKSPENFKISLPLRTNYLFGQVKKSLPEMYAFTVCMWLKSGSSPGIGTPFSYGVPGQANEIVLIEWGHNPIELLINDKVKK